MKFLAWNLNHKTNPKPIPPGMADVIVSLSPDVVVFTEYVQGASHKQYVEALGSAGLDSVLVSAPVMRQNQVLIASRMSLTGGQIRPPMIDVALPSNVLHVKAGDPGIDILGIRIPDLSAPLRREVWNWILSAAREMGERPSVLLGDFNTDPSYKRAQCGDRLGMVEDLGWQRARPSGASWRTLDGRHEKQIDHAFFTSHFCILSAEYVAEWGPFRLFGKGRQAMSDHAALFVEVEPAPTVS